MRNMKRRNLKTLYKVVLGLWLGCFLTGTYITFTPEMHKYNLDFLVPLVVLSMIPLVVGFVLVYYKDLTLNDI